MSSIMDLIRPDLFELSALELENLPYLTSANIDQTVPNLATIYMPIKSQLWDKSSQNIGSYLPLNLEKIAQSDFVYTPASTNIDHSAPNLDKMYMTLRSRMTLIMDVIRPELSELSALEFENFPYLSLFTLWHLQILTNQHQTWSKCI